MNEPALADVAERQRAAGILRRDAGEVRRTAGSARVGMEKGG
jgi:hypothetical protein